jgi:tetratricopeptide (TPR) repeat protein
MDERQPSFQDLVRRRQQTAFVGREGELDAFLSNLQMPLEERALLISISGQGGMGKTFLARQFANLTRQHGFGVGWSDESEADLVEVMAAIAQDLGEQRFRAFFDGERIYRTKRHELESDPDVPSALIESLGEMLGRGGVRLARHTPGLGVAFELVSEQTAAEAGRQAASAASFVARKLKDKDELELVSDPVRVLTPRFVSGLTRIARDRGVLLVFDTFEATRLTVQPWLRELLGGAYGELPGNLMIVLAGRDPLDSNVWADYEPVLLSIPVEAFGRDAARAYLSRHGISEPEIVETIVELAQGLPLLLATLASRSPMDSSDMGDATDTATERFLKWLASDEHRQIALRGAIPRVFDQDVLAILLGDHAGSGTALDWLRQQPFVAQRRDGWHYHDLVRSMFGAQLRRESPQAWKEANERLADGFDSASRQDPVEATYHATAADPRSLGPGIVRTITALAADDPQRAFALAQAMWQGQADADADAEQTRQLIDALSAGRPDGTPVPLLDAMFEASESTLDAAERAQGHLALTSLQFETDSERAWRHAEALVETGERPLLARAVAALTAGELRKWETALSHAELALALAERDGAELTPDARAMLHQARGIALADDARCEEALAALDTAVSLEPDDGDLRATRASILVDLERMEDALAEAEAAAVREPSDPHAVHEFIAYLRAFLGAPGVLDAHLAALACKSDCLACWENVAELLEELDPADARRRLGELPAGSGAVARFGRALALDVVSETAEAEQILDELIAAGESFSHLLLERAEFYLRAGDVASALPLLRQAEPSVGSSERLLVLLASRYRRAGDLEGAERAATEVLKHGPTPVRWLARADIRALRGDRELARADLRAGQDAEERNVAILEWRAGIARDLGEHDLALADLELWASALGDEGGDDEADNAWRCNQLGLMYSHLGRWDAALGWIERALASDPDELAFRYNRLVALVRRDGVDSQHIAIEELRRALEERDLDDGHRAYARAGVAALLGERETALMELATACEASSEFWEWARRDRAFDELHGDRAFAALGRSAPEQR